MKKHIALWGAWYGSHNVGDQALLLTIMDILAGTLGEVRFTVFTSNPAHVLAYTREESTCQINALHNRRQFHQVISTLAACDLLILGGGVPFYQERTHVLAMALLIIIARLSGTPYMTWAVSSQIVQSRLAMGVFRWVLEGAQAITCRDEHTHDLFRSFGLGRRIHYTADPAFCLKPARDEYAREMLKRAGWQADRRPLAALTPRNLRGPDGEVQSHYIPKTPSQVRRMIECFAAALDWQWEQGLQPIIVPMNTQAPDDDRLAGRMIMKRANYGSRALIINEEVRPSLAPAIYKHCLLSFVARVHGSIASMIGQCPVMMYAFAPKHRGIMTSMGLQAYSLTETEATPSRTVERLSALLAKHSQMQRFMAHKLDVLRQEALLPAQFAAEILGA